MTSFGISYLHYKSIINSWEYRNGIIKSMERKKRETNWKKDEITDWMDLFSMYWRRNYIEILYFEWYRHYKVIRIHRLRWFEMTQNLCDSSFISRSRHFHSKLLKKIWRKYFHSHICKLRLHQYLLFCFFFFIITMVKLEKKKFFFIECNVFLEFKFLQFIMHKIFIWIVQFLTSFLLPKKDPPSQC